MLETGFNINYVAFHFDIHKIIAYQTINPFVQTKSAGDRPRSGRQKKKITPLEETFIQITSRRVIFLRHSIVICQVAFVRSRTVLDRSVIVRVCIDLVLLFTSCRRLF